MSDSESDDDLLLMGSVFAGVRSTRSADKEKLRREELLGSMLKETTRQVQSAIRMSNLRQAANLKEEKFDDSEEEKESDSTTRTPVSAAKPPTVLEYPRGLYQLDAEEALEEPPNKKNKRLQLMEDIRDEQCSCFGLRKTIHFDTSRCNTSFRFCLSTTECEESLSKVLDTIGKSKEYSLLIQKSIATPLKNALDRGLVDMVLKEGLLGENLADGSDVEYIPDELVLWLIQTLSVDPMGEGALQTLIRFISRGYVNDCEHIGSFDRFINGLAAWVVDPTVSADNHDIQDKPASKSSNNLGGFTRFLSLWTEILRRVPTVDGVSLDLIDNAIVSLVHAGLDVSTLSRVDDVNVVEAVQGTVAAMINLAATKTENDEVFLKWVGRVAGNICKSIGKLGPGQPVDEDSDDDKAWICYSKVASVLPAENEGKHCKIFKASVAVVALETVSEISFQEKEHISLLGSDNKTILDLVHSGSVEVKAILSSFICLKLFDMHDEADLAQCFAVADCCRVAFQSGLLICQELEGATKFGSTDSAKFILRVSNLIQNEIVRITATSNRLAGCDHMRRLNFLVALQDNVRRNFNDDLKVAAGLRLGGQTDLNSFFSGSASILA